MPGECPCRAGGEASGSDEPQSGDHSSPLDLPLPSFSSSFSSPPAEQIDQEPSVNVVRYFIYLFLFFRINLIFLSMSIIFT